MGLVDKAKGAAKVAADAAQKGLDDAKDAGQVFALKRSATNLTEQLGNVVFRQHEGEAGLESEVTRLVEEIRAVKAEIASIAQE
jgi:hypothetical protein